MLKGITFFRQYVCRIECTSKCLELVILIKHNYTHHLWNTIFVKNLATFYQSIDQMECLLELRFLMPIENINYFYRMSDFLYSDWKIDKRYTPKQHCCVDTFMNT